MGYSSPKKQLDLNDFLSRPGNPRTVRNSWKRTTKAAPKARPAEQFPVDLVPNEAANSSSEDRA